MTSGGYYEPGNEDCAIGSEIEEEVKEVKEVEEKKLPDDVVTRDLALQDLHERDLVLGGYA